MKKLSTLFVGAVLLSTLSGCGFITSSQPSSTAATGEAWFTKVRVFLIFPYAKDVYYCDGKSNVCKEAEMKSN